jgi:hypothetical protein
VGSNHRPPVPQQVALPHLRASQTLFNIGKSPYFTGL